MRIFKKVALIFSIVVLVLSLSLNVCLFLSSTNRLILKDDDALRLRLYYTAYSSLYDSPNFTIKYETTQTVDSKTTKETINLSCSEKLNYTGPITHSCSMITTKLENDKLIKTSYVPGDGYSYSVEGETKTKKVFTENDMHNFVHVGTASSSSLFVTLITQLLYSVNDIIYEDFPGEFKISGDFDFKSFSLIKTIDINKTRSPNPNAESANVSLKFDGKDRISFIHFKDNLSPELKFEISYKKTIFDFPSFDSFVQTGGAN